MDLKEGSGVKVTERRIEKRKYPRVATPYQAEVLYGNRSTKVDVANMSIGGAMFHSQKQFNLGDIITMVIAARNPSVESDEHLPGKIVAISRKEDRNSYGLQFSTLLQVDKNPSLAALLGRGMKKGKSFLRDPRQEMPTQED